MMVLKRIFVAALGVAGFFGFGAGLSLGVAQDQIPAPRLYSDVAECAGGGTLPSSPTSMGSMSALERALAADAEGVPSDLTAGPLTGLHDPSGVSGCDDNPVAGGYSEAVRLYEAYISARDALPDADADPDPDATEDYNEARAALEAYAGPVFSVVYDQQAKFASADEAIDDYNDLVGPGGDFATLRTAYSEIDFTPTALGVTATDDQDTDVNERDVALSRVYGSMGVQGYQGIVVDAETDSPTEFTGVDDLTAANIDTYFDDAGALKLQTMSDPDPEAAADARVAGPTSDVDTLGAIATRLSTITDAVKDFDDALEDAIEEGNLELDPYREDLRRAQVMRDHVQGELDRLTGIARRQNPDLDGTNQPDEVSIGDDDDPEVISTTRELLTEFGRADARVQSAANGVRNAVSALERTNIALKAVLQDPQSHLEQLVNLRQYQLGLRTSDASEFPSGSVPEGLAEAIEDAEEALMEAQSQLSVHNQLTGGDADNPGSQLLQALLEPDTITEMGRDVANPEDDDGRALVEAISSNYEMISELEGQIDDVESLTGEDGAVTQNTAAVVDLDGRVTANEDKLADHDMKLMQKKEYIDNLAAEIGVDPVTGAGTEANGMSRIDNNETRSMANATNIVANSENILANTGHIMDNRGMIETNTGHIMTNTGHIMENRGMIEMNTAGVSSNADAIAANMNSIGANSASISDNRNMIGELSESLDVVRAGVAASMALAGMPAINGRGISIGVGSFDGESAFAVGFQIQGEMTSFKVGLTSGGGATGASAGVGFQF